MKTAKQIFREFWLPFLVASFWTFFIAFGKPRDLKTAISGFGTAFFLASWMTGQFFRVRKQEGLQVGLSSIENRLIAVVGQLETNTQELASHMTGGDSYCYFAVEVSSGNTSTWTAVHEGKYSLYGVGARIVDAALVSGAIARGNPFESDRIVNIGELPPSTAKPALTIDLGSENERDFNVFFSARNGFRTQLVRLRRANGRWRVATRMVPIENTSNPGKERVDEEYPLNPDGSPVGM